VRLFKELNALWWKFEFSIFRVKWSVPVVSFSWTGFTTGANCKMSCTDIIRSKRIEWSVNNFCLAVLIFEVVASRSRLLDFCTSCAYLGRVALYLCLVLNA